MSTTMRPTPGADIPLHIGSCDDFARVKGMLDRAAFDEPTVCRVLGIDKISAVGNAELPETAPQDSNATLIFLLIRLFLFLESVPQEEVEGCIEHNDLASLLDLDLLRLDGAAGDDSEPRYYSPVLLAPIAGLAVASDRYKNPDGSRFDPPADVVFPSIYAGTLRFLRVLSKSPAGDVLDIGAGSGVGALASSRHSERVIAIDITARAVHFARFNCLLNGLCNVQVLEGDLYSSVEDETFDRIIAHPPYVPSMSTAQIYRDAGQTGEALIKRIVEGLTKHLRPGGSFFSVCAGWDAKGSPFEERVREWLGDEARQFDVIFAFSGEKPPGYVARQLAERSPDKDPSLEDHWNEIFSGMERLAYGALVISRMPSQDVSSGNDPVVLRTHLGSETEGSDFEWFLLWRRWRSRSESDEILAKTRPVLGPGLRVKVTHVVDGGALVPVNFILECERPFPAATNVDPWIASLLREFDGDHTAAAVHERARQSGGIPEAMSLNDFINLVGLMIERGYLQIDKAILTS